MTRVYLPGHYSESPDHLASEHGWPLCGVTTSYSYKSSKPVRAHICKRCLKAEEKKLAARQKEPTEA